MSKVKCRKVIDKIQGFVPAKPVEAIKREYGVEKIIKLAGNENNLGCSPHVKEALVAAFEEISLYPDANCTVLKESLSRKLGVKENQFIFGDGMFELLSLIAQTYIEPGDEAIIPEPTFGWYKIVTIEMDGQAVGVPLHNYSIDLETVKSSITEKTKIIWLSNPNNPTGTYFNEKELKGFLGEIREDILVVLDEAYYEYVEEQDYPDSIGLLKEYPNIIILRTFSKIYGLASLRIGYGIAEPEIIDNIHKIRAPVNVNTFAQVAAAAGLQDTAFQKTVLDNNTRSKKLYYDVLNKLGVSYIPTHCNFIMVNTGMDCDQVVNEYLKEGILIRGGKDFGMPTWVRISIGTYEENEKVLGILAEVLKDKT